MKKILSAVLILTIIFSITACTQVPPSNDKNNDAGLENSKKFVTVTHDLGTVEVPYDPQKIAVLDMSVLDMLDVWGLADRVVGMPKASEVSYLMSYSNDSSIVNLGTLFQVDMEALMATEPDIIFIGSRLSSEYENLSKIAPVVFSSVNQSDGYIKGFKNNVNTIASIFGKEADTNKIFEDFDKRIEALNAAASGKTAIVGIVTSGSFSTLGKSGRCSLISNEAGFENLADDIDATHGNSSSFEFLLDKNPDYIFALDRDTAIKAEGSKSAKEVLENEIVMKTDSYKNGQIIYLTPDAWYLAEGGITATRIMIEDLEKGILGK